MKPITLHPLSVLAGPALAGVAVLLIGAAQTPTPTRTVFVGEVPAEWWTYVELRTDPDGTPTETFTVPLNRHFVVSTCLRTDHTVEVFADGEDMTAPMVGINNNGTRVPFPPGALLTAGTRAGYPGNGSVDLWGYLEPVR